LIEKDCINQILTSAATAKGAEAQNKTQQMPGDVIQHSNLHLRVLENDAR
jgi:hypothetical protein